MKVTIEYVNHILLDLFGMTPAQAKKSVRSRFGVVTLERMMFILSKLMVFSCNSRSLEPCGFSSKSKLLIISLGREGTI